MHKEHLLTRVSETETKSTDFYEGLIIGLSTARKEIEDRICSDSTEDEIVKDNLLEWLDNLIEVDRTRFGIKIELVNNN